MHHNSCEKMSNQIIQMHEKGKVYVELPVPAHTQKKML